MLCAYHSAILGTGREGNLALNWWPYSMMNLIRVAALPASLTHHGVWCGLSLDYPSAVESGQHIQSGWLHVGKAWCFFVYTCGLSICAHTLYNQNKFIIIIMIKLNWTNDGNRRKVKGSPVFKMYLKGGMNVCTRYHCNATDRKVSSWTINVSKKSHGNRWNISVWIKFSEQLWQTSDLHHDREQRKTANPCIW